MSLLTEKMKGRNPLPVNREPLWRGPTSDHELGGVTQSLLGRYLCCHERFRISYMEGLKPVEKFSHRIEFGNMWHNCEEAFAKGWEKEANLQVLTEYAQELLGRYPLQQQEILHWYNVCAVTFPEYARFWSEHPDVRSRTPLMQEQVFDVPYRLPGGRTVRLRGKFDAVDLIGSGKEARVYLFETKTKGEVDEQQISQQMTFDLQTMLYLVALKEGMRQHLGGADVGFPEEAVEWGHAPVHGVRYNVVRRPLSGGKGTIVRHKGKPSVKLKSGKWSKPKAEETHEAYYTRLHKIIAENPKDYFHRWSVAVGTNDLDRFRRELLDPVLENLCDDYEWWAWCHQMKGGDDGSSVWDYVHRSKRFHHHQARHYRFPYGVNNSLVEGYSTDLDQYLADGTTVGLHRATTLFEELR